MYLQHPPATGIRGRQASALGNVGALYSSCAFQVIELAELEQRAQLELGQTLKAFPLVGTRHQLVANPGKVC